MMDMYGKAAQLLCHDNAKTDTEKYAADSWQPLGGQLICGPVFEF
jgi:hypothetical protein